MTARPSTHGRFATLRSCSSATSSTLAGSVHIRIGTRPPRRISYGKTSPLRECPNPGGMMAAQVIAVTTRSIKPEIAYPLQPIFRPAVGSADGAVLVGALGVAAAVEMFEQRDDDPAGGAQR